MNKVLFDCYLNKYGTSSIILDIITVGDKSYLRVEDWCFRIYAYNDASREMSTFDLTKPRAKYIGFGKPVLWWSKASDGREEDREDLCLYFSKLIEREDIISFDVSVIMRPNLNRKCIRDDTIDSITGNSYWYISRSIDIDVIHGKMKFYQNTASLETGGVQNIDGIHIDELAKNLVFNGGL